MIALAIDRLVALCAAVPYAVVALGLRLIMAGAFFPSGQAKIAGPAIPFHLNVLNLDFSVVLPAAIKDATFAMFQTQYANLPIPPAAAAYLFTYAEFVLPICLVIGFATRFAALALLVMLALIDVYVTPDAFWPMHVYWIAILTALLSIGPGAISIDHLIRKIYRT